MIEGWSGLERGQKMNPYGNKIFSLVSLSVVMETGPEVVSGVFKMYRTVIIMRYALSARVIYTGFQCQPLALMRG